MVKEYHNPTSDLFLQMPKIELHRHLEGAVRFETLLELAKDNGTSISDPEMFEKTIKIQTSDTLSYKNFLTKFHPLRKFYKSPEAIKRIVCEVIEDSAADNIHYLELRFSPTALSNGYLHDPKDVIKWVSESMQEASKRAKIETRLIVSLLRHEAPERADEIGLAAQAFQDQGVVGIDLAGDEANFSALPFLPIFERAHDAGLKTTLHAGEWKGAENVLEAIEIFNAARIGHGVRVMENENAINLARERGIVFEVCVTSNFHSGVVASLNQHPIGEMIAAGLNITINTDDPQISQITLTDEMKLLSSQFGFSIDQIHELSMNALNAAFVSSGERNTIMTKFNNKFDLWKKTYFQSRSSIQIQVER